MQLQIAGRLIMVGEGCAGLQVAPRCYWGMQLQIARRLLISFNGGVKVALGCKRRQDVFGEGKRRLL